MDALKKSTDCLLSAFIPILAVVLLSYFNISSASEIMLILVILFAVFYGAAGGIISGTVAIFYDALSVGALNREFWESAICVLAAVLIIGTMNERRRRIREELKRNNDRFIEILDGMQVQLMLTDPETYDVIFANQEMRRGYNIAPEETLRGKKCYQVFQGQTEPCSFCYIEELKKNPSKKFEWTHYNELTNQYYKKWESFVEWQHGKTVQLQQSVNITSSTLKEERLKKRLGQQRIISEISQSIITIDDSNQLFEHALELVATTIGADRAVISRIDREKNICHGIACWEKDGEYNPEEDKLVNLTVDYVETAFIIEERKYFTAKNFSQTMLLSTSSGKKIEDFAAAPIVTTDGLWGFVLMESYLNEWTYDDDTIFMTEVLANLLSGIEERRLVQSRVHEAEDRMQAMLDSTPIVSVFFDENCLPIDCNGEAQRLFGLDSREEVLRRFFELMPMQQSDGRDSRAASVEMIQRAFGSGYEVFEWMHLDALGKQIPVEIKMVRIDWRGGYRVISYMRDLTKDKAQNREIERTHSELVIQKERAEESAKVKSNFLANMSHEIRTPMNAIISMGHVLSVAEQDPVKQGYIQSILRSSELLLLIINDILDFTKIDASQVELVNDGYSPYEILCDVVDLSSIKAASKGLTLLTEVAPNFPRTIYGDGGKVRQIMTNLFSNALKYTPKGTIEIKLSAEPLPLVSGEAESCMIRIDIKDTGLGIKPEDMERLFRAFSQLDLKVNRGTQGTGLGLAICDGLSKAMGGRIEVESVYGEGSTFSFVVEQQLVDASPAITVNEPKRYNVLVFGEELVAGNLSRMIRGLGIGCDVANDIDTAVRLAESNSYTHMFYWYQSLNDVEKRMRELVTSLKPIVIKQFSDISDEYMRKRGNLMFQPVMVSDIAQIITDGQIGMRRTATKLGKANTLKTSGVHVLIVDDNDTNLIATTEILKQYNVTADVANGGALSVQLAKEFNYDLIFMDQMMPDVDGIEATKQIRKSNVWNNTVPIIALTANAIEGVREMLIGCGMNDFITKPIMIAELERVLIEHLPKEKLLENEASETDFSFIEEHSDVINAIERRGLLEAFAALKRMELPVVAYLKVVYSLNKNLPTFVTKLNDYKAQGDMQQFRIEVHSQKSALANVGAERQSELAKQLEAAAEKGDMAYIDTHLKLYCSELDELCHGFSEIIGEKNCCHKSREHEASRDKSEIREELLYARELIKGLEYDIVLEKLDELMKYGYGETADEMLQKIYDAVENFDVMGASTLIDELITQ